MLIPLGLQLEFLRKRYHKDILSSPVLMLNFCPDLLCEPLELHKVTRELLFLVDRSGSMSGTNIHRVKVSCNEHKTTNRGLLLDSGISINVALSCLYLGVSVGSHGGGTEESPFSHHAEHCGLWHDYQASLHLQQALH